MARFSPYSLQLQITRLFKDGQSLFASSKVEQFLIETVLKRRDGQPVEDWVIQQIQEQV
jgi:hypothetical protein